VDVSFRAAGGHGAGVGSVEPFRGREIGCNGDREQPPLAGTAADQCFQLAEELEAGLRGDEDSALALDDEETIGIRRIRGDEDRPIEAVDRDQDRRR
jgi:hypothetical protein